MVLEVCFGSISVVNGLITGLIELTGDPFSAIFLVVIALTFLAMALQLPLEVSAIFVLPFLLVCFACVPNFTAVTGVTLLYLGVILAKNF